MSRALRQCSAIATTTPCFQTGGLTHSSQMPLRQRRNSPDLIRMVITDSTVHKSKMRRIMSIMVGKVDRLQELAYHFTLQLADTRLFLLRTVTLALAQLSMR